MTQNIQKEHYERIHDAYEDHYYDQTSLDYRSRYILAPLIAGVDLENARIADIACGSGWNTRLLSQMLPKATFHGFDISEPACEGYRKNTGFDATCCDVSAADHTSDKFDAAIVIGGLHHMVNNLPQSLANITSMVKSGGTILACEPNAGFFLNGVRKAWYKADAYFEEDTERALSLDELKTGLAGKAELHSVHFFGDPAYIMILNSLVLRIPLRLKRPLARISFVGESLYNMALPTSAYPAFLSKWRVV